MTGEKEKDEVYERTIIVQDVPLKGGTFDSRLDLESSMRMLEYRKKYHEVLREIDDSLPQPNPEARLCFGPPPCSNARK